MYVLSLVLVLPAVSSCPLHFSNQHQDPHSPIKWQCRRHYYDMELTYAGEDGVGGSEGGQQESAEAADSKLQCSTVVLNQRSCYLTFLN
jgi:hypothetical protein